LSWEGYRFAGQAIDDVPARFVCRFPIESLQCQLQPMFEIT
jgi:hypothetical protein